MKTSTLGIGTLVRWKDEDGSVALGEVVSAKVEYNAGVDMDLTHVTVRWSDGHEPTQHTLEAMARDPRVTLLDKPA